MYLESLVIRDISLENVNVRTLRCQINKLSAPSLVTHESKHDVGRIGTQLIDKFELMAG